MDTTRSFPDRFRDRDAAGRHQRQKESGVAAFITTVLTGL